MKRGITHIVGVDEVGRGPLAGPVTVCAVSVPRENMDAVRVVLPEIRDSKKISPRERDRIAREMRRWRSRGVLDYAIRSYAARDVDAKGVSACIGFAVARAVRKAAPDPRRALVLLDGGLRAPKEYARQSTIVKGDEKELCIALASVVAKVYRDELMRRFAARYPAYGFEAHKGYGTRAHRDAIRKNGLCDAHRRYFCKNLTK